MAEVDFEHEASFMRVVVEIARLCGWLVVHVPQSVSVRGRHMTAYAFDGKGWPDLTLVHPERGLMFRELKTNKGRLGPEQVKWLRALYNAGADAGVWRPCDLERIKIELGGKANHATHTRTNPIPDVSTGPSDSSSSKSQGSPT